MRCCTDGDAVHSGEAATIATTYVLQAVLETSANPQESVVQKPKPPSIL